MMQLANLHMSYNLPLVINKINMSCCHSATKCVSVNSLDAEIDEMTLTQVNEIGI